jgi:hypothetical protein
MLITTDLNSSYFDLYTFIMLLSPDIQDSTNNTDILMVASGKMRSFVWIPKYVVNDGDNDFEFRQSPLKESFQNKKVILLSDKVDFERYLQSNTEEYAEHKSLYNRTYQIGESKVNSNKYDQDRYPYTNMIEASGLGEIEVRVN